MLLGNQWLVYYDIRVGNINATYIFREVGVEEHLEAQLVEEVLELEVVDLDAGARLLDVVQELGAAEHEQHAAVPAARAVHFDTYGPHSVMTDGWKILMTAMFNKCWPKQHYRTKWLLIIL